MKPCSVLRSAANHFCSWAAIGTLAGICDAQVAQPVQAPASDGGDYAIAQVGPHSRVWQNSAGQSVTEIETGMNYWNGEQWTPSDPSFSISADGTAFVANKIQDPTQLAANINSQGAVTTVTPDGVTLQSTPIAIGLYDAASGLSVVVATITNSAGVQVDSHTVVYTNVFAGNVFSASIVYSLPDAGSFHQDVVFTGFNSGFDPTTWGFDAASTNTLQVQIFTEFYGIVPQPQVLERQLYIEQNPTVRASMALPDFIDYSLDFGHYVFGPGRAYTTSTNDGAASGATVAKDFVTSNGRTFLVESIRYSSLIGYLTSLPSTTVRTSSLEHVPGARRMKVAAASVPSPRERNKLPVEKIVPAKAIARVGAKPRGVVIDYIATVSSISEPKLYSSDTTYFVSGTVYESSPVTMESAVFKYPTNSGTIEIANTLTLATTNYRTAIFTSADDNTAGAPLSTNIWTHYTGNPSGKHYGNVALWLQSAGNIALNNLRFCYMNTAIEINADATNQSLTLSHLQLVDCITGIYANGGGGSASLTVTANNCLMANIQQYAFEATSIKLTGIAYNCTVDTCYWLLDVNQGTSGAFNFTNSIFSTLTSEGSVGTMTIGGAHNGFYGSPTFGSSQTSVSSSPYASAGAGNYYLLQSTSFLTNGTTNIPAAFLAQLESKTTGAPLSYIGVLNFSTIFTPLVPRDTYATAIGFHYDPIDLLCKVNLTANKSLILTNGVVLAYYSVGLTLGQGCQLASQGSPNNRNYLVYYNLVQEEPILLDGGLAQALPISSVASNSPSLFLRFTSICIPTGETNFLNTGDAAPYSGITNLTMRDCEIYGSGAAWQMSETNTTPIVELTNNLFYRVPFSVKSEATITSFNNLFYGTTNYITNISGGGITNIVTSTPVSIQHLTLPSPNTNENNVFDGVTVTLDGTSNYNVYLHGATNTAFINNRDIVTNLTWQAGAFGSFYQPTNSPLLNNGSTNASNLGLFHYTVTSNNILDGSNAVSRGYHYVAVGTNGLPLDSNNDGLPNYLEDTNGDGTNNDGESWNTTNAPFIGTQPISPCVIAGDPATFTVWAYGTAPLSYQWISNGVNIGSATSSSYTIPSVSSTDTANYTVKVTNSSGSVTSAIATIIFVIPPQLTNTSPSTNGPYWFQTAYDHLSTTVTNPYYGSATPAYYSNYFAPYLQFGIATFQWQLNGTTIPSASGTGASVTYVATNDGGTNTVVITNLTGSTNVTWTNVVQANPGMVETWGSNGSGECNRPVTMTNVAAIAAGIYQSIAVSDTGSISNWGQYSDVMTLYNVTDASHATQPPTNLCVAVAAGLGQGLAITTSNNVIAWGLTNSPAATIPLGLQTNNVIAIACGWEFDMELFSNGTVQAWGVNATNVPANLSGVTAIAAGQYHALALSNGTVVAWGDNTYGQCSVPTTLSNVVAIAAGDQHSLALQSNGIVFAWGRNISGQTNVPAGLSNVMAVAAGSSHSVALLNNGTIVAWGDDTYGETNVPQSNPSKPLNVKLIAAGGNHTIAGIFSSWVQYPVNVSKDLLLIYNSNSVDSWNVCEYYRTNRPMVSSANVLRIGCASNTETIDTSDFSTEITSSIRAWLTNNPTKRPSYVILFQDIPSRVSNAGGEGSGAFPSVQMQINASNGPGWQPFVTSINMNSTNGTTDCEAYIDKLRSVGSNFPGRLFLSGTAAGLTNDNYYFDDSRDSIHSADGPVLSNGVTGVLAANPLASIIYTNVAPDSILANHLTNGVNVAGYSCWGLHSALGGGYPTNQTVKWSGSSGWWIIRTLESFNGDRMAAGSGNFLKWYATNAFGGTNYSKTPVGAVSYTDEPGVPGTSDRVYFGLWESGKAFAICAWDSRLNTLNNYPLNVGDPFVVK